MSKRDEDWAEQRKRAIAVHSAELARKEAAEASQASRLLADFVAAARAQGIEPVALAAGSYDGKHRYRTKLRGWYLTEDERFAVDEDGRFYILTVPGSRLGSLLGPLRALVAGAQVEPARPRLVIGEGGRDGERIPLRALLDRALRR
jgi:hypothetical protein